MPVSPLIGHLQYSTIPPAMPVVQFTPWGGIIGAMDLGQRYLRRLVAILATPRRRSLMDVLTGRSMPG